MASTLRLHCFHGVRGSKHCGESRHLPMQLSTVYPYQEAGKNTVEHERSTKDPLTIYSEVFQTSPTDIAAPRQERPALIEGEESAAHPNVVSVNVAMLQEAMAKLNSCPCMLESPHAKRGPALASAVFDGLTFHSSTPLLAPWCRTQFRQARISILRRTVLLTHNISQLHEER